MIFHCGLGWYMVVACGGLWWFVMRGGLWCVWVMRCGWCGWVMRGGLWTIMITKHSCIATSANTFPWFVTNTILASRISHTGLTIGTFPTELAPAFSWFVTPPSSFIASFSAYWFITKVTLVAIVTLTFHGFGAVAIMRASRQFNALIAISTCPSRMASENKKFYLIFF